MQEMRVRKGNMQYSKINDTDSRMHRSVRTVQKKRRNFHFSGIFAVVLAFAVISGCMFTDSFPSLAQSEFGTHEKLYKSIIIEKGDTLWNIAETYMTDDYESVEEYVSVLKDINNLKGDKILFGDKLIVSYSE